jgi:metallo-beta-lactamase class B
MRKLTLLLCSLLLPELAFAQGDPTSRSWNQPVEPFRIAGNLYYVGANEITSFLLTSKEGHIVLDGGFVETAPMILANIRKLGFRPEDVKILLSSHAHLDHAGGLAELKRVTGARFYSSRRDLPQHARGGLDDPQFGNRFPYPPVYADRVLDHGSRVRLGPITMVAHMTPGHTPGCTTWTTTIAGKDVVFLCSPSIPSEYRLRDNPRYPDAIADYRRQFQVLKALTPDIWLASHGNFFDLEEKRTGKRSFVDPEGYRRFVEASEQRFEKRAVE